MCVFVRLLIINCHSVVTGVWSLPATGSHPNAWLPVLSPPYSSGHRPPSLATPSPKRTLSLPPHPPPPPLPPKCVFLSPLHISTHPANPIFHLLTSNTPVSPPPFFSLFFLTLLSSWSDSPPLFSPQFPSPSSPHRALCLPPTPPRWRRPPRKRRSRSHARIRNRIRGGAGAGSLTGCSSPYARRWGRPSPSSSSEP